MIIGVALAEALALYAFVIAILLAIASLGSDRGAGGRRPPAPSRNPRRADEPGHEDLRDRPRDCSSGPSLTFVLLVVAALQVRLRALDGDAAQAAGQIHDSIVEAERLRERLMACSTTTSSRWRAPARRPRRSSSARGLGLPVLRARELALADLEPHVGVVEVRERPGLGGDQLPHHRRDGLDQPGLDPVGHALRPARTARPRRYRPPPRRRAPPRSPRSSWPGSSRSGCRSPGAR